MAPCRASPKSGGSGVLQPQQRNPPGWGILSTDPFPHSQRAPLPLKPISIPFTHSPSPQCSPGRAEGEQGEEGGTRQAGPRAGCVHREHFREEETSAVFQVHTGLGTKSSWISAAPALSPPPRPFSQPKGQWRADINNPMGSAQGSPACPHCCLASPSAELRPARHNV